MGKREKARCTQMIMAECTGKWKNENSRYPVYEFDYEGKHYKVSKQQSAPGFTARIGASYEIYINPNNPEEYYHPLADAAEKRWGMLFVIVFGVAFLFQAYLILKDLFI